MSMKVIPHFEAVWLTEPIDIIDNENGMIQLRLKSVITEEQKQLTMNYLILEGFIEVPKPPVDDYQLHPDLR